MHGIVLLLICAQLIAFTATSIAGETIETPAKQTLIPAGQSLKGEAPLVVIYTLSTCGHCREAKEYLNDNKITYINREVDTDDAHMEALMKVYDSMGVPEQKRGVPLFVIGDRIKIQGFSSDKLRKALKEVASDPK